MRHIVKCSMRQSVLGGKQRRTTEPGARSLSVMNLPPCQHSSELQEAAGFLAIHRGLKTRVGQKFQPGGYFRSWTTVILAKNSEATLTSPIGFFVNFDTGCVPQALKRAVCSLPALALPKARRGDESQTCIETVSPEATFEPSIILTLISSTRPLFRPIVTPFFISTNLWVRSRDLETAFRPENKILLIGAHFLLLFREDYSSSPYHSQCRHPYRVSRFHPCHCPLRLPSRLHSL